MLTRNEYWRQLAVGVKEVGQLSPDTIKGCAARVVWSLPIPPSPHRHPRAHLAVVRGGLLNSGGVVTS